MINERLLDHMQESERSPALRDEDILRLQLSLAGKIGQDFFEAAVLGLHALTGAGLTIIGATGNGSADVVTLAMGGTEGLLPGTRYALDGMAAETLAAGEGGVLVEDVTAYRIADPRLEGLQIKGYIGCPIRDSAGDVIGIVEGLFKEKITNHRFVRFAFRILAVRIMVEMYRLKSEQKLREQQERYEFAMQAGGFGIYDWNIYTQQIVCDAKFHEIIEHTTAEFKPSYENWISIVHPDDYDKLAVGLTRQIDRGREYYAPRRIRIRTRAGQYKWIQIESYSLYYDVTFKARRNVGIIKDVDAEVRNEEQLQAVARQQELLNQQVKEREERYAFALKVGNLGVYDWHVKEKRTIFSPILAEMMGRQLEEYDASHEVWLESIHPEDRGRVGLNAYTPKILKKPHAPSVYRMKNHLGGYRWVEAHNMAIGVNAEGEVIRMIGVIKDIEESKRAADMLSASLEKLKTLNLELSEREETLTETQAQLIAQMSALKKLNRELRESEARWAYALEGNGDGVIEWNIALDEVFFSARAREVLRFHLSNVEERKNFMSHIHPDSRDEFVHSFRLCLKPPFEPFQMEVQIIDDQQNHRWVMFRGKVVEQEHDKPLKMVGTVTDLSQLKLFQKEFTIYEEMIKQSQSIVLFTTQDGTIEFINATAITRLEYRLHEVIGNNITMLLPGIQVQKVMTGGFHDQLTFYTRSGKKIVTEVTSSLIRHDGFEIGYVFNAIDITEKTMLEEKVSALTLAKLEAQLEAQRKQTEMVIEVQENEKERIARELHDSVGQLLSLAKLHLEELEPGLTAEQRKGYKNLKDIVQHINTDVKGLTRDLMPLSIRNLGLESALRELLERYNNLKEGKVKIFCKIHLDGYSPDQKSAIHIYRTAQEAINNSIKYSGATSLSLICMKLKNSINLVIEDNGIGFDYDEQLAKQNSFGLKTMKERARLVNGKLYINSAANAGTTISLTIPLT